MRTILGNLRSDDQAIEFGRIATISEIRSLDRKVKSLKNVIAFHNKVLSKVKNFIIDYPKLSTSEKLAYRKARNLSSRNRRELTALEPKSKIANASRDSLYRMPTMGNIIDYAESKNIEPSSAAIHYDNNKVELLYPYYIELIARNLNRLHRTFKNTDEPHFDSGKDAKLKWLDLAVIQEDKTFKAGSNPIIKIVTQNKTDFQKIKKSIINIEKDYVQDAVKDHIGKGTKLFSRKDIKNITSIDYQDLKPKDHFMGIVDVADSDNELGGFFKRFLKIVLSPAQVFANSITSKLINKAITSSIVRKNIPSHLFSSLSGLSEASANIMVGKINKKNLRKAVKYIGQTTISAGRLGLKVGSIATKPTTILGRAASKTSVGRFANRYTGGIATSGLNLYDVQGDLADNKDIDWKARGIDALKVGMAVSAGAGAIAIGAGTRVASERTVLGKSSIGRGIITAGGAVAGGGGSNVFQRMASQRASKVVRRKIQPTLSRKIGGTASSLFLDAAQSTAVQSSGGSSTGSSLTSTFTQALTKTATKEATSRAVTHVAGDTAGAIISTAAASTYGSQIAVGANGEPIERTNASFLEQIGQAVKEEAKTRAMSSADRRTGGKLSKAMKAKAMAAKYKDMTPEEFKRRVQEERQTLYARIEEERINSEQKIEKIQEEIEAADSDDFKQQAMSKIEEEERRLDTKAQDMKDSFQKGISKATEDYENFNTSQFLADESQRIGDRIGREKDRFLKNASGRALKLAKKYGPQLFGYLMWKYGPQMDYDNLITDEDRSLYMNWKEPKIGPIVKRRPMGLGLKIALGLGAVMATKMAMS